MWEWVEWVGAWFGIGSGWECGRGWWVYCRGTDVQGFVESLQRGILAHCISTLEL